MAAVSYLSGGEKPTALRINSLIEEFDRRLGVLLGGRSFILAFTHGNFSTDPYSEVAAVPVQLMGNPFFFTSGPSAYAHRVPGAINIGTGGQWVVRPYNHAQFTAAAAAVVARSADAANHVLTIERVPEASYNGLPSSPWVGFFAHSLEAHRKPYPTASDPQHYFLEYLTAEAEKHHKFSVAEIILEGVSQVSISSTWNKYSCFRLHNLNAVSAKVTFPGFTVILQPFQCQTVRRDLDSDGVASNYRQGFQYFFRHEAGDPRFYWFFPTSRGGVNDAVFNTNQRFVFNGMVANNLTNPSIIFDWIAALRRFDGETMTHRHAWWEMDEHEVWDAYPLNSAHFGDPSEPGTRLGDLLHHKGRIIIAKVHKTEKYPNTTLAKVEFAEVQFNGYGTIVADFAAKNLTVAENGSGNLVISQGAADADYTYELLPIGTNLFKRGETIGTVVTLPATIEDAVFEDQGGLGPSPTLTTQAPLLVNPRTISETANVRSNDRPLPSGNGTFGAVYAGATIKKLGLAAVSGRRVLSGIHKVFVSDLLNLSFFGDKNLLTQSNAYATFDGARLRLTNQGLVLTYTERVISSILPDFNSANYANDTTFDLTNRYRFTGPDLPTGFFEVPRVIKFRGHGWGYGDGGRAQSAFYVPRYGRHTYAKVTHPLDGGYAGEFTAPHGGDFSISTLGVTESNVRLLRRVRLDKMEQGNISAPGRFWLQREVKTTAGRGPLDGFVLFDLQAGALDAAAGRWYSGVRVQFREEQWTVSGSRPVTLPLLPEHYNALARAVNSLKTGSPLSYQSLRWVVGVGTAARPVRLTPATQTLIMPIDCFSQVAAGSTQEQLYQRLGISVLSASAFPASYQTAKTTFNQRQAVDLRASYTIQNVVPVSGGYSANFQTTFAPVIGAPADFGAAGDTFLPLNINAYIYNPSAPTLRRDFFSGQLTNSASFDHFTDRNPSLNLNTAYAGVRWVKVSAVKTFVEAMGFPFVWHEVFTPLKLAVLDKGDSFTYGPLHMPAVTFPLTFSDARTAAQIEGTSGTGLLYNKPQPRNSKIIAFHYAANAGEAEWKQPTAFYHVVHRTLRKLSPASVQDWTGHAELAKVEGTGGNNNPSRFFIRDFYVTYTVPNLMFFQIWFGPGPQEETYSRFYMSETQPLAHYALSTDPVSVRFQLAPRYFWGVRPEWWNESRVEMAHAFLDKSTGQGPMVWRDGWTAKQVVAGSGLTMIQADAPSATHPNGTAYRVIYDPTGALADLT